MPLLDMTTLWLRPAEDCGPCTTDGSTAPCAAARAGRPGVQPRLDGEPATVSRLLRALKQVRFADDGRDLVGAGQIASLRVAADEAELVLAFPRGCGLQRLAAEEAFQVLRRELPDTDVYVMHAP